MSNRYVVLHVFLPLPPTPRSGFMPKLHQINISATKPTLALAQEHSTVWAQAHFVYYCNLLFWMSVYKPRSSLSTNSVWKKLVPNNSGSHTLSIVL